MRLLGSLTSPYVRKVRIVLAEKKIDYQFELDDVWNQQAPIHSLNPLGKVPCLILESHFSIFDSRAIIEYVDSLSAENPLIPMPGQGRAEVRVWESLAEGILDAAVSARLEATWPGRTQEERCQAWIDRQMSKIESALQFASSKLADRLFCVAGAYSLADISLVCALDYLDFRFQDLGWKNRFTNLSNLQSSINNRASFMALRTI
ncbi:MAG: glutathione S-transferase family protein [Leptothrix ochracea]|uniref:glutathione S-transferase family protein n=1 Tax=Leptothrix ochracea TaxID=735331 RepID=UPI0034E2CCE0